MQTYMQRKHVTSPIGNHTFFTIPFISQTNRRDDGSQGVEGEIKAQKTASGEAVFCMV
jgi:hypothetical protein